MRRLPDPAPGNAPPPGHTRIPVPTGGPVTERQPRMGRKNIARGESANPGESATTHQAPDGATDRFPLPLPDERTNFLPPRQGLLQRIPQPRVRWRSPGAGFCRPCGTGPVQHRSKVGNTTCRIRDLRPGFRRSGASSRSPCVGYRRPIHNRRAACGDTIRPRGCRRPDGARGNGLTLDLTCVPVASGAGKPKHSPGWGARI